MAPRMNAPLYTTEILRLAASLKDACELGPTARRAELRSPTCGSRICTSVELNENRRVRTVSQQVHACAFGQASAAILEQHAIGRSHDEVSSALLALSRWLAGEQE